MPSAMKRLHCEHFQLTVKFDLIEFHRDKFMRLVAPKLRKKVEAGEAFHNDYPGRDANEHAHARISIGEKESELMLIYATGKPQDPEAPIRLEEAAKDIAELFKDTKFKAEVFAVFEYDNKFEPVVRLDYPLLLDDEFFHGAMITGHDITFPEDSPLSTVSISSVGNHRVLMVVFGQMDIDLAKFDPHTGIKSFGKLAEHLVKKR